MPEGHSIHRLARQFNSVFGGRHLAVSSPQGRFSEGAALLDGHVLLEAVAYGKQLFLRFDHDLYLRAHLGLYGAWDFGGDESFRGASSIGAPRRVGERETAAAEHAAPYAGPPAPTGTVRVRLVSDHGWADLRGATACEVITEGELAAIVNRLGPDPLAEGAAWRGLSEFAGRICSRATPIALLLMNQEAVAGIGNVYRAEVLFRQRIHPWTHGRDLDEETVRALWVDIVRVMQDGVRDGRIITTEPEHRGGRDASAVEDAHYVYKRQGLECRICGTLVRSQEIGGRRLYWCPGCQA